MTTETKAADQAKDIVELFDCITAAIARSKTSLGYNSDILMDAGRAVFRSWKFIRPYFYRALQAEQELATHVAAAEATENRIIDAEFRAQQAERERDEWRDKARKLERDHYEMPWSVTEAARERMRADRLENALRAFISRVRLTVGAPAALDASCNIAEMALTPAPEGDGARQNAGEGVEPSTLAATLGTTPSASLRGGPAPVKHWSMQTALEQISACKFECEGGPLTNNDAWRWLVGAAKVGPEFWPGQGVWFEIEAEAAGKKLTQWVHFYIVGCQMDSGTDSRYWTYDLSYDPPAPYHYGTVHFTKVRGERLRLEKPEVAHV